MSICVNTIRALPRCRIPIGTLLPFLYQTATIREWKSAAQPVGRRHIATRRPKRIDQEIPFEDASLSDSVEESSQPKTTITGSERVAFKRLYRKFSAPKRVGHGAEDIEDGKDGLSGQDEESQAAIPLDEVFGEAMKGSSRVRKAQPPPLGAQTREKSPQETAPTEASKPATKPEPSEKSRLRRKEARAANTILKEVRLAERERIDRLLQSAPTDSDVWSILQREVLDKVHQLQLDGIKGLHNTKRATPGEEITASDPRVLFQNYPHHLITVVATLRDAFPASPLPANILPAIKALGRASYALGATTALYRHLIRTAWIQQSSYMDIDMLLDDMNNGAVEFDAEVLALLDSILKEHDVALSGRLGRPIQLVYGMEHHQQGSKKIREWRELIVERLGLGNAARGGRMGM